LANASPTADVPGYYNRWSAVERVDGALRLCERTPPERNGHEAATATAAGILGWRCVPFCKLHAPHKCTLARAPWLSCLNSMAHIHDEAPDGLRRVIGISINGLMSRNNHPL